MGSSTGSSNDGDSQTADSSSTTGTDSSTSGDASDSSTGSSSTGTDSSTSGDASESATKDSSSDSTSQTKDSGTDDGDSSKHETRRQSDDETTVDSGDNSTDGTAIDDPSGDVDIDNTETSTFGSDSGDVADQGDGAVDDDDSDPDNAEYLSDSTAAMTDADDSMSMDNFTYTTINDLQNTFSIVPGEDGNIYASALQGVDNGTSLFAVLDNVVGMDDASRALYYYPDVMSAFNASRIRLGNETHLPKTADFISLMPINYDSDSSTANPLFAVNSNGDPYLTVLCTFTNGAASKMFIVSDETGIDALQTEALRYIVTGAPVDICQVVTLVFGTSDQ